MKLLAIDTATEACSAALWLHGEVLEKFEIAPRRHTSLILPMVQELLQTADVSLTQLDAVAVDRGPGSFTGVRIGTGVVQGLAYAADLPVIPISSLAALAQAIRQKEDCENILALIDARMQEVYWAHYVAHEQELHLLGEEQVSPLSQVTRADAAKVFCVGSGSREYMAELQSREGYQLLPNSEFDLPHAAVVAELAHHAYERNEFVHAAQLEPIYLRNQVVDGKTVNK